MSSRASSGQPSRQIFSDCKFALYKTSITSFFLLNVRFLLNLICQIKPARLTAQICIIIFIKLFIGVNFSQKKSCYLYYIISTIYFFIQLSRYIFCAFWYHIRIIEISFSHYYSIDINFDIKLLIMAITH